MFTVFPQIVENSRGKDRDQGDDHNRKLKQL